MISRPLLPTISFKSFDKRWSSLWAIYQLATSSLSLIVIKLPMLTYMILSGARVSSHGSSLVRHVDYWSGMSMFLSSENIVSGLKLLDFEGRAFAVVKRRNKCSSNRSEIILFEFTNNSYKKYITISWMIHDIGSLEPFDFILAMQSRKRVPDIMFITDKGTTFPPEESWVFGKPSIVRRWRQGK